MATNLRVNFKERQCKHLSESIAVVHLPAKRSCTEEPHVAPVLDTPSVQMPHTGIARPKSVSAMRPHIGKDVYPERDRAPTGSTPIGDDLEDEKDVSTLYRPPSWEKMVELLKQVPYSTEVEPPSTKLSDFFSLTKQVIVDIDDNPLIFITT